MFHYISSGSVWKYLLKYNAGIRFLPPAELNENVA